MALSADVQRKLVYSALDVVEAPMAASTTLYKGSYAESASGYIRACTQSSSNVFAGILLKGVANAGSAGAANCRIVTKGIIQAAAVSGAAVTDINATVYASADDTLTLTSTNNIAVGKVQRFVSSGVVDVRFEAGSARSI